MAERPTAPEKLLEPTEETDLRDTTTGDGDIDSGAIARLAVWLAASAIVILVGMWYLSKQFKSELEARDPSPLPVMAESRPEAVAGPRLQSDPNKDMAQLRAEESAALTSYAWLSPEKTLARIPVDRAIEIVLESGLPKGMGGVGGSPEERAAEGAGGSPLASEIPPAAPGGARK